MRPCLIGQATGKCAKACQRIQHFGKECTYDMISDFSDGYLSLEETHQYKSVSKGLIKRFATKISRREKVFIRDNKWCYICEKPIKYFKDASIDHVIPLSKGGSNALSNIKITHRSCNNWKGSHLLEELDLYGYRDKINRLCKK